MDTSDLAGPKTIKIRVQFEGNSHSSPRWWKQQEANWIIVLDSFRAGGKPTAVPEIRTVSNERRITAEWSESGSLQCAKKSLLSSTGNASNKSYSISKFLASVVEKNALQLEVVILSWSGSAEKVYMWIYRQDNYFPVQHFDVSITCRASVI